MRRSILETFQLTPVQLDAASLPCDLSVGAGAGAGKTNALTARYLHLVEEGRRTRGVTAITFTERAAREMRNRIRQHVQDWLAKGCPDGRRAEWEEIEANLDAARIGTIHSLCAAILRAHPAEAQVDPRFDVLDEGLAATLQKQAVEDTLSWVTGESSCRLLFEYLTTGDLEQILSKLLQDRLQATAAFDCPDPARAWSHALTNAILQFLNRAEVREALVLLRGLADAGNLLDDAGDKLAAQIDGLLEQLNRLEKALAGKDPVEAAAALFTARREFMGGSVGKRTSKAKQAVRVLREVYDETVNPWLGGKGAQDQPPDPELEARVGELTGLLRQLFDHALALYGEAKDRRQALDFDDLEARAQRLMQNEEVRRRWQDQIDALLVDEFQDTNERQRQIIQGLAGDGGEQGRLFVVGDPKQSIYRFRGADVTVFRKVEQDITARGGRYLSLDRTFRAHDSLVEALNEILANVMGCEDDPARPYYIPFRKLEAERRSPRANIREPYVEFLYGLGEKVDESRPAAAQLLARRLRDLHDAGEIEWQDVACLFRASTGFPAYEAAFEKTGIPFVTVAGRGFYERPEIRDLLNILRAVADPTDDLAMAGLLRSPAFGFADAVLYQLRRPEGVAGPIPFQAALKADLSYLSPTDQTRVLRAKRIADDLAALVDRVPVGELLKQVLVLTNYPAILASAPAGERLSRNVDKLLADAQASGLVSVDEFLEYIETLRDAGAREGEAPAEAGGSVRLMSVHKAKGLEFPVVVIADASRSRPPFKDRVLILPERGVVCKPGRKDESPLAFGLAKAEEKDWADAEDLRLLYVAATRAQEKLIICAHQSNSRTVWFNQLCEGAGLDPGLLASQPGEWDKVKLPDSKQRVGFFAAAGEEADSSPQMAEPVSEVSEPEPSPLYRPVTVHVVEQVDEKLEALGDLLKRARRLTGRPQPRDGTLVGELFHLSVQRWCFPDDPRLDGLLRASALELGLGDTPETGETARYVKELLSRLRADPLWAEIDSAPVHRHEVPYRVTIDDHVASGIIDLLYRTPSGAVHIVDFKTEAVGDVNEVQRLIAVRYGKQMQRYREAAQKLLGEAVISSLCFLDFAGTVRWEKS